MLQYKHRNLGLKIILYAYTSISSKIFIRGMNFQQSKHQCDKPMTFFHDSLCFLQKSD